MTPAERQAIRDRARPWMANVPDYMWSRARLLADDVLALDNALTEAERVRDERIPGAMWDAEYKRAEKAEKEAATLRAILRDAQFFITNVPQDDSNDPTGEGREIASEILAKIAALATGTTPK
jgi:hypothetical protein